MFWQSLGSVLEVNNTNFYIIFDTICMSFRNAHSIIINIKKSTSFHKTLQNAFLWYIKDRNFGNLFLQIGELSNFTLVKLEFAKVNSANFNAPKINSRKNLRKWITCSYDKWMLRQLTMNAAGSNFAYKLWLTMLK